MGSPTQPIGLSRSVIISTPCAFAAARKLPNTCSFLVPWLNRILPGYGPVIILLHPRPLLLIVELCFSGSRATSYFASPGLLRTLSTSSSILSGDNETTSFFRGVTPSHLRLIAQLRARVSFFLPLFFKRFRSPRKQRLFLRQWGANGTLGFLTGDSFKVTL